jgi:RNA polymerase sigma factor (sigma-70 family)
VKNDWIREILEKHECSLLNYAYKLCNDLELARDATQDTFLKLCREDRNKVEDHLTPWLFTVCRNRIFEILRKEKRMTTLSDEKLATTSSDSSSPAKVAEMSDNKTQLHLLLKQLNPNEQEVIRLKFEHGMSYKEISDITSLSQTNVGFILHNSIKTLRNQFNSQNQGGF